MEQPPARPHSLSRALYGGLVVPVAGAGYRLAGRFDAKAREGLRGREGWRDRFVSFSSELQGAVWMHAASVGEYEQARPVLRRLRDRHPGLPTLQTVFSPSGWNFAQKRLDADRLEYLPLDRADDMRWLVRQIEPSALVFLKFDVWPNLVWEAREAGVPIVLLDATLHRRSHRLKPVARGFFGRLFDCFSALGAISEEDAERFREGLGCRAPIVVTGDTRTDQVVHRWRDAEASPLARALRDTPFEHLALGSVWPADTEVVLDAALGAVTREATRGLLAVPHEPDAGHLEPLERAIEKAGLKPRRLSELVDLESREPRVDPRSEAWRAVVVDTVGVLAELYRGTALSYVGGSFSTGVHNVLEPAVTGQPVLFGPRIHNAYEAERLVERGAGFVVRTASEARERFEALFADAAARNEAGQRAQSFVLDQSGATEASVRLLEPLLTR